MKIAILFYRKNGNPIKWALAEGNVEAGIKVVFHEGHTLGSPYKGLHGHFGGAGGVKGAFLAAAGATFGGERKPFIMADGDVIVEIRLILIPRSLLNGSLHRLW